MKRKDFAVVAVGFLTALAFWAGPIPEGSAQDGTEVQLFFTGDIYAYLKPCG